MGIRPYARGQVPVPAEPDDVKSRFGAWVDDLEDAGEKSGEAYVEIDAKASSSNEVVSKLSADLTSVEKRVDKLEITESISGTGWDAQKRGGVVVVYLRGVNAGWTMPAGWRPKNTVFAPVIDFSDAPLPKRRIAIASDGLVSLFDTAGSVFGHVTYIVA